MKSTRILLIAFCLISLGAFVLPRANAGDWDEKSMLTFDHPVELPGVVLPAGTYIFKLIESPADRNIVQVRSSDERTVYATINAIPKFRAEAPENTLIVYEDRAPGAPKAIKEWFYPDRIVGHEFVYSKKEPIRVAGLAESSDQPAESAVAESNAGMKVSEDSSYFQALHQHQSGESGTAANSFEPMMPTPNDKENEPVLLARADEPESAMTAEDKDHSVHEMPHTASFLPFFGISGLLLVTSGTAVKLLSR